jgi:hypothetical protein
MENLIDAYPPVVVSEPMQHWQRVVSPQYGHVHLQSSIE